jgi:hypothetical protein
MTCRFSAKASKKHDTDMNLFYPFESLIDCSLQLAALIYMQPMTGCGTVSHSEANAVLKQRPVVADCTLMPGTIAIAHNVVEGYV